MRCSKWPPTWPTENKINKWKLSGSAGTWPEVTNFHLQAYIIGGAGWLREGSKAMHYDVEIAVKFVLAGWRKESLLIFHDGSSCPKCKWIPE